MDYYVELVPGTWYHTPLCYGRYGDERDCFLCIVKGPCQSGVAPTPREKALELRRTYVAQQL